ncbi:MAG TPA: hypothetical protein VKR61_19185 [Bryobacteraceae bacterium]|nr:hypothetical protein [Bryobacteraceae bacterium]
MSTENRNMAAGVTLAALALLMGCGPLASVTTYHYDNYRSGWNQSETTLTSASVAGPKFGELYNIALDDQVDTQPLILPVVSVTAGTNQGAHNVVYVATESNTIYMIDAVKGTVLFSKNFGAPVPTPLGCSNNGPNVGINGTPVIDAKTMTMYVITYTLEGGAPVYRLHALDPGSLAEKMPNVVVSASHVLSDGHTIFNFDAKYQRQRAGLLQANGNVYAGFGSFCDFGGGHSRGWVLGWNAAALAPLAANQMNDTQISEPHGMFLSSVWMSGSGIAADGAGNLYFVTGNSDPSGTTYDGVTNIQESVVKESPDLSKVLSLFTPSDQPTLDQFDSDYGSGGVLLLPKEPSQAASAAAAAGKNGNLYVMDLANLGGKSAKGIGGTPVSIGGCWCAQSYFSNGSVHIVSSGGSNVILWTVQTSPALSVIQQASSGSIGGSQDPGFFTSVSSNGTGGSSDPIVWAVSRPDAAGSTTSPAPIGLWAFKGRPTGTSLPQIYHGTAGGWAETCCANANIVPVVANGSVFVASYKQLRIFGLH